MRSGLTPQNPHAHASARADGEHAPVIGRRAPLDTNGLAPNIVTRSTQLISARAREPRQWVITLMQAIIAKSPAQPWLATKDGTNVAFVDQSQAGANFGGPVMPSSTSPPTDSVLQVHLRWGAGGVAYETLFDYPAFGKSFGITADALDLDVFVAGVANLYATADLVPIVGAFMVEGIAADPTPLRWTEKPHSVTNAQTANYAIKPYARKMRLSAPASVENDTWLINWQDSTGHVLWQDKPVADKAGLHVTLDVPDNCTWVAIENDGAAAHLLYTEWQIGLT